MNNLGKYLEQVRREKKFSLREAAQKSDLSYTYIRDIELGMNRKTKKKVKPSPDSLKKLAEAYGIEYYELLQKAGILDEGTESALDEANSKLDKLIEETVNNSTHISTIPLIRTICAGDGIIATENIEDYVAYPLLKGNKPDYALRVQGDSMKDVGIDDGDIVFLKAANWVEKMARLLMEKKVL